MHLYIDSLLASYWEDEEEIPDLLRVVETHILAQMNRHDMTLTLSGRCSLELSVAWDVVEAQPEAQVIIVPAPPLAWRPGSGDMIDSLKEMGATVVSRGSIVEKWLATLDRHYETGYPKALIFVGDQPELAQFPGVIEEGFWDHVIHVLPGYESVIIGRGPATAEEMICTLPPQVRAHYSNPFHIRNAMRAEGYTDWTFLSPMDGEGWAKARDVIIARFQR